VCGPGAEARKKSERRTWAPNARELDNTERLLDRGRLLHPRSLTYTDRSPPIWGQKGDGFVSCPVATAMILPMPDDLVPRMKAWGSLLGSFLAFRS
jgi:hypothetical protein